jgi:hypothetical protein
VLPVREWLEPGHVCRRSGARRWRAPGLQARVICLILGGRRRGREAVRRWMRSGMGAGRLGFLLCYCCMAGLGIGRPRRRPPGGTSLFSVRRGRGVRVRDGCDGRMRLALVDAVAGRCGTCAGCAVWMAR